MKTDDAYKWLVLIALIWTLVTVCRLDAAIDKVTGAATAVGGVGAVVNQIEDLFK